MRSLLALGLLLSAFATADVIEEIVVTGSYIDSAPPAQRILKQADNLLLKILITNDARGEDQRKSEIYATLLGAIKTAGSSSEFSISAVTPNGFVRPLSESNYKIDLLNGVRPDTNQAYFRVRTPIPVNADAEALLSSLKRFAEELKMEGRTLVEVEGDVEVSIVDPQQYRPQVIELMAKDIAAVTSALGPDYRAIVTGVDKPVEWARVGSTDVAVFIPYEYVVVPTSIASYNVFPDY